MNATRRALATLVLVLTLMGAAWGATVREVGSLGDDYQATLTVYRVDNGQVGISVLDDHRPHISVMSAGQALYLADLLEEAWGRRGARYGEDEMVGKVLGNRTVYVAIMRRGGASNQVAVSVQDGAALGVSFWSQSGQIRYLANTLRRAAR